MVVHGLWGQRARPRARMQMTCCPLTALTDWRGNHFFPVTCRFFITEMALMGLLRGFAAVDEGYKSACQLTGPRKVVIISNRPPREAVSLQDQAEERNSCPETSNPPPGKCQAESATHPQARLLLPHCQHFKPEHGGDANTLWHFEGKLWHLLFQLQTRQLPAQGGQRTVHSDVA